MGIVIPFKSRLSPVCWSPKPPGFYRCARNADGKTYLHGPGYGFLAGYFDIVVWNFRWLFSAHTWDEPVVRYDVWIDEAIFFERLSKKRVDGKTLLDWAAKMAPVEFVEFCVVNHVANTMVLRRIREKARLYHS